MTDQIQLADPVTAYELKPAAEKRVQTLADSRAETSAIEKMGEKAVQLTGDSTAAERTEAVDAFQNDSDVRVLVGSITARRRRADADRHRARRLRRARLDARPRDTG